MLWSQFFYGCRLVGTHTLTIVQQFAVCNIKKKRINTFIQQGCIELIIQYVAVKYIYNVTKDFYFK